MGKIDTSGWKEFRVGELFAQERGKEKAPKQNEPGDCPLIQETNNNNGFDRMVVPTKIIKGNSITVSINYAQNVFYQADDFCASVNIAVLRNSHLNRYNSQFVCSVLRNAHQKFDYTSKISKELLNKEMIMLPVDKTGQPDWAYMESYMANLETKVTESLTLLQAAKDAEKKKVDTREWGEFRVGELFDIHPTKAYKCTNAELLDNGETHVVVNSAYNNGVGGLSTLKPTEQGNMITFSDTVDANTIFYQDKPFIGYPHVQGLYPIGIFRKNWTELSLKYFATVFRQKALSIGFDYGNKFRRDIAVKLYIFLPVDKTGQPDWAYMEEYMRKMEERVKVMMGKYEMTVNEAAL